MEVNCIVKHIITCLRKHKLNKLKKGALYNASKAAHAFLNNGFCSVPTKAHANVPHTLLHRNNAPRYLPNPYTH